MNALKTHNNKMIKGDNVKMFINKLFSFFIINYINSRVTINFSVSTLDITNFSFGKAH